jgi:uncharacterized protein with ParB-like and HNH nuclease domain
MASGFSTPITIKEAIDNIVSRTYLLPAIQRKFVWSSEKIEMLFDSIMRGYPINSFMFWEIKEPTIKNEFKFYQFLTEYREFFKEDNLDIDTKSNSDFFAVIDGQQRLTSIYLGLKGSYAYKMPRKWWRDDEESIPTRWLYLNLEKPLQEDDDRQMKYDFRFLTKSEYNKLSQDTNAIWYKINNILTFESANGLDNFIDDQKWRTNDFAKDTIRSLRRKIFEEKAINFYLETTQEIDTVLDIFIRTNSGGEPLNFSDLLMSITTANWTRDARKEIPDLVNKVFEIGKPGFMTSKDFILKTCLVLFNDNIKFQVKNFDRSSVQVFDQNWERISKSIIESFKLLESWGFNNSSLRAKNAIIPIIYYVYHNNLEDEINNKARQIETKSQMRKWLCLSLLKGVFGGHSDAVLTKIRAMLKKNNGQFPLEQIRNEFKSDPAKNLSFDDDFIDGLLTIQKDEPNCYPVLSLLYSHLDFGAQEFHKDHLHPASYFMKLKRENFATEEDFNFYSDPNNWNSIANLQLLNSNLNQSKLDTPLVEWVKEKNPDFNNQLIPHVSLEISDFRIFIEERKTLLRNKFKEITG